MHDDATEYSYFDKKRVANMPTDNHYHGVIIIPDANFPFCAQNNDNYQIVCCCGKIQYKNHTLIAVVDWLVTNHLIITRRNNPLRCNRCMLCNNELFNPENLELLYFQSNVSSCLNWLMALFPHVHGNL